MKKIFLLEVLFCLFAFSGYGAVPGPEALPADTGSRTALLLIDIQEFYFDTTKAPLTGRFEAARQAGRLLAGFRENGQVVVHVMHKGGGDIRPEVAPLPGEKVIVKEQVNCFRDTPLLEYLKDLEINRLVIAGMMTHMCVEAAVRAADDLGFETLMIGDACATRDLRYGDEVVPAREVHLATLATLKYYARVLSTDEYLEEALRH
jgi:nicotinamidase-related amidase